MNSLNLGLGLANRWFSHLSRRKCFGVRARGMEAIIFLGRLH